MVERVSNAGRVGYVLAHISQRASEGPDDHNLFFRRATIVKVTFLVEATRPADLIVVDQNQTRARSG